MENNQIIETVHANNTKLPHCVLNPHVHFSGEFFFIVALRGYEQTTTHILAMAEYKLHQGKIVDKHYFAFYST